MQVSGRSVPRQGWRPRPDVAGAGLPPWLHDAARRYISIHGTCTSGWGTVPSGEAECYSIVAGAGHGRCVADAVPSIGEGG